MKMIIQQSHRLSMSGLGTYPNMFSFLSRKEHTHGFMSKWLDHWISSNFGIYWSWRHMWNLLYCVPIEAHIGDSCAA